MTVFIDNNKLKIIQKQTYLFLLNNSLQEDIGAFDLMNKK